MIEYVVVHEFVHLIEPHHTNAFWDRVERMASDWSDRASRHFAIAFWQDERVQWW